MEVRDILQTIGMEAAVLAFLFGITYIAVRISSAERRAQGQQEESFATIYNEQRFV